MDRPRGKLFPALVRGPSMSPTLRDGDAILVWRTARIKAGDVVVGLFAGEAGVGPVVKRAVREAAGGWWLEGDNAFIQDDSRRYGPAEVVGRVLLRWWPPLRWVRRRG